MTATAINVYYLEMRSPADLRPKWLQSAELVIVKAEIALPEFSRFLYTAVGTRWSWWVRTTWSYKQWQNWFEQHSVHTWVAYLRGTPAGYFELEEQADGSAKIAYFGVIPRFIGQGLGAHLLSFALERAWQLSDSRVWLHTCSLDHPHALRNYQARGLQVYREETVYEDFDNKPLQLWPGADVEPAGR